MSDQENPAARFAQEVAANTEKVLKATQLIANTRDKDVKVGTTPKHLVMRRDKVELFRYEPFAQQIVSTPVLVAYGLVGRYTPWPIFNRIALWCVACLTKGSTSG